jgi:SAM-dependent methyltransferase
MTASPTFDPVAYKRTTTEQWQQAADAWHAWDATLQAWLGPVTATMLDLARLGPGDRVLDVAAGAGEPTLSAAATVGPGGYVLATDIAPNMLAYAEREARRRGLANVQTQVMDGETLTLEEASFDAVLSRVGLIYFPDRRRALAEMRRVLKPGGRVVAAVYSTPERNSYFSLSLGVLRRAAALPPPAPGQPGPFSLGGPGVLEGALRDAGFTDVAVRVVSAPLHLSSAAECARFEREAFGAFQQLVAGLPPDGRAAAWDEVAQALGQFEADGVFVGPGELLVGAGTR